MMEANRAFLGDNWKTQVSEPADWEPVRCDVIISNPPCAAFSGMTAGYAVHGADSKINECMWCSIRYAARVRPAVFVMESVSQAFTNGKVLMHRLAQELNEKSGLAYRTTHIIQDNYSTGGCTKRKRYFLVLSQVPFGVELPDLWWLPTLGDALGDLRGLPLSWDEQKVDAVPTWWSYHLRNAASTVDGHSLPENGYTRRQLSLINGPVRWEEGDSEADVLARYYEAFGELPEEFRYAAVGKHKGLTRDKVLIDRGLNPGGFSQARCWPWDEPGRVMNGAGPYMVMHPDDRLLTNREAARIMGFPDDWKCGSLRNDKALHGYWGKGTSVSPAKWILDWVRESLDGSPGSMTGDLQPDGSRLIDISSHWRAVARRIDAPVPGAAATAERSPRPPASPRAPRTVKVKPEKKQRQHRVPGRVPEGFTHRECDRMITREVFEQDVYRPLVTGITPGEVILDLGAHIGCFTRYAADRGAHVVAVEMLPGNLELLAANTASVAGSVTIVNAAVTASKNDGAVTAVMSRNPMGAFVNGTKRDVGRPAPERSWEVPAVSMPALLAAHRPSRLKCDIEASEYDVLDPAVLAAAGVTAVMVELHIGSEDLFQKGRWLYTAFEAAGYRGAKPMAVKPSGWGALHSFTLAPQRSTVEPGVYISAHP
jgi:FkbM family methyltransferase